MTTTSISVASPRRVATVAVAGLLAGGVLAPPAQAAPPSPRPAVVQQKLDHLVGDDTFPGALAAVKDDRGRVRDYTAGVGNLSTRQPVPRNGRIRSASNTKPFTAVVMLQLADEGKVELDAPVETYLPGLVRGEGIDGRNITVRQLLNHTSGLPDYIFITSIDFTATRYRQWEPQELLRAGLTQPALSPPGTRHDYSNTNYLLAGMLIEKITGRTIGQEITSRIIGPLRLRDTYWPAPGEITIRGAHPRGYYAEQPGAPLVDATDQNVSAAWAAGALVSTPRDLLTFFTALLQGKLLTPDLLRQMQTTVPSGNMNYRGIDEEYGLGLATFPLTCGGTAWTHGGNSPGYLTRQAVTANGRGVVLTVTALPQSQESGKQVEDTVNDIMCADRQRHKRGTAQALVDPVG